MPSRLHEALVLLFRNRPALAPELVREALRAELPPYSEARIESANLTQVVTPNERVACWAREPIELGGGNRWMPWVIGPSAAEMEARIRAARIEELDTIAVRVLTAQTLAEALAAE